MSSVLDILDRHPKEKDRSLEEPWGAELERSLGTSPQEWVEAAGAPGSEALSRDHAWVLLSWVESAGTRLANERQPELLETAAFALSLLESSPLDRRDVMVVAILLHRAADVAALEFTLHVRMGCGRAGALGEQCLKWLPHVVSTTPMTHEEAWVGAEVRFRRKPKGIDFEKLERWFNGKE